MSRKHQRMIRSALRRALYASLGLPMLATPLAFAQQAGQPAGADQGVTKMEKTVVTGSLIPTADTVGASPVEAVDTAVIEKVGAQDVLEALRRVSSSFSGNGNTGRDVNNGGGGESYIALRNLPTLVLLNGRRLANSAFSSGAAVDVSTIPTAMIERIEVLKDGASALYGSDAIGGVVNVITKKNYNGVEIGGQYGFTTADDDWEEYRVSVVGGVTSEKASFIAGAQYYHATPLISTKRDSVAGIDIAALIANNMTPPSYMSPSYPTRVDNYILAGSPFAVNAPGYNAAMTTPPSPGNPLVGGVPYVPGTYANLALYRAAHPGVYIPISTIPRGALLNSALLGGDPDSPVGASFGYPILNTAQFGTYSLQSQDRRQFFASGESELIGKELQFFGSFLYANTHSEGALAPSPVSSLSGNNIVVPIGNFYNPFGTTLGPANQGGTSTPRVRTRFVDSGLRLFDTDSNYYQFTGGFKGEFMEGKYSWETGFNYARSETVQTTKNAISGAALDQALTPNSDAGRAAQGLSQLRDSVTGAYVPQFNVFSWGGNDPATIRSIQATLFQDGVSELYGYDGMIRGTPFKLPGGDLGFAVGGGWYQENLNTFYDPLTQLGKVPGLNPQNTFPGGSRDAWNVFVEVAIPIFSEENKLPVLQSLEITAAGRYESFDPGGDKAVPKVGIRWQPLDKDWIGPMTLRGTYSQSFLAPTVFNLFGPPVVSFPTVTVGGGRGQQQVGYMSNPDLEPATAETISAGFVYSPKWLKGLTVSVDYYNIKMENDNFNLDTQSMIADLQAGGSGSQYARYFTFDSGVNMLDSALGTTPNQITLANWGALQIPQVNGAEQRTDGLDLTAVYEHQTEKAGKFTVWANANWVWNYQYRDPVAGGWYSYEGQFTDFNYGIAGANGAIPDYVINCGIIWDYKDFSVSVNSKYVPPIESPGDLHPAIGDTFNFATIDGTSWQVEDWYQIDMQVAYEIGKSKIAQDPSSKKWYDNTRIAVGMNNITDNIAPLIAGSTEDNTAKEMYDILGRMLYFQVSKKF